MWVLFLIAVTSQGQPLVWRSVGEGRAVQAYVQGGASKGQSPFGPRPLCVLTKLHVISYYQSSASRCVKAEPGWIYSLNGLPPQLTCSSVSANRV